MTKEEAYNRIKQTIDEYFEFVSLVKKMNQTKDIGLYLIFAFLRKKIDLNPRLTNT